MKTKKVSLFNAIDIIFDIDQEFFTVEFIKKDKSLRKMNCRKGVKKHLKGGHLRFDPFKKGLLPVFDLQKQGYRMISLKSLVSLTFAKTRYEIE